MTTDIVDVDAGLNCLHYGLGSALFRARTREKTLYPVLLMYAPKTLTIPSIAEDFLNESKRMQFAAKVAALKCLTLRYLKKLLCMGTVEDVQVVYELSSAMQALEDVVYYADRYARKHRQVQAKLEATSSIRITEEKYA